MVSYARFTMFLNIYRVILLLYSSTLYIRYGSAPYISTKKLKSEITPNRVVLHGTASHYNDVIMNPMASQITSLTIVYSTVYSGADQRKHQSSVSLAFVCVIHRWPVNFPHKGPVTRNFFPFDDVIILITSSKWSTGSRGPFCTPCIFCYNATLYYGVSFV